MSPGYDAFAGISHSPGTVQVTRAIRRSAKHVWEALTEPQKVSRWFGDMSSPPRVGELINLDFGDGDFFTLEIIQVDPPYNLQYIWRLLGIGPKETITWRITPKDESCLVTVIDSASPRTPDTALALRKVWLDHTSRLKEFLSKDKPVHWPWHHEFYAVTELPGNLQLVWEQLLASAAQAQWFPLSGSFSETDLFFSVKDGAEPAKFQVTDVELDTQDHSLSFRLIHKDWLYPTNCNLNLRPCSQGVKLTIRHIGWEAISFDDEYQKQQRKRFAILWFKVLLRFTLGYIRAWGISTISPVELQAQIDQPNLFLFDSNRDTLWEQGHIPGAIFVGQEDIAPELLPPNKDATLVFYCRDSM